jgi:hypothetical protein
MKRRKTDVLLRLVAWGSKTELVASRLTHDLESRRPGGPGSSGLGLNKSRLCVTNVAQGFWEAWQDKRMMCKEKRPSRTERDNPGTYARSFSRPDLAIPRWVAPLQSPTPFHQATFHHNSSRYGLIQNRQKRLPGRSIENRHKRLPGRYQVANKIYPGQIGTLDIIISQTHPQSSSCRF